MGRIIKILKTLRNNWKKSTFGALALAYGINYGKDTYDTRQLMRHYCEVASKYGEVSHPVLKPFREVTVILNPVANKRKAKSLFDKYCAPLLYLAGLSVTVIQTEYAGQAKELLETMNPNTDAIVIAGGDGTLAETVTGLLRRANDNLAAVKKLPLGVLPLGKTNSIAEALLGKKEQVQSLIDATMAVIDGEIRAVDVIKIQPIEEEEESTGKPIYSLAKIVWGSYRDALAAKDKYWYFGGLRQYVSYLFSSPQENIWECTYAEPCSGCSECFVKKADHNRRWWHIFIPRKTTTEIDYSKVVNENCSKRISKQFTAVEFQISSSTVSKGDNMKAPQLSVELGSPKVSWTEYVMEGWSRIRGNKSEPVEEIPVREIELKPVVKKEDEWLSIDSEDFEVKPMKVTVMPKTVNLYHLKSTRWTSLNKF